MKYNLDKYDVFFPIETASAYISDHTNLLIYIVGPPS